MTAGPTHEPIDDVRFLGNRSSGRLGIAIAVEAARRGWPTTLLLGPVAADPHLPDGVELHRFTTSRDLEVAMTVHGHAADLLIMAAAVADHRPVTVHSGKLRRGRDRITLELEPVPDLIGEFAAARRHEGGMLRPTVVAFALEPTETLEASARAKLAKKGVDAIVANPIETLAAAEIDATLIPAAGAPRRPAPPGVGVSKGRFAVWLLEQATQLASLPERAPAPPPLPSRGRDSNPSLQPDCAAEMPDPILENDREF